jgi:para-aminobenzoate synthetase component 1
MPQRALPCAAEPMRLLGRTRTSPHAFALDGGGSASWGSGWAYFADAPLASLAVDSTGRGCWRSGGSVTVRQGSPLQQWRRFLDGAPSLLAAGGDRSAAGFLTVLSYDLKHWIERLPHRHAWPPYPVLYCAFYDWFYRYDYQRRQGWVHAQGARAVEEKLAALSARRAVHRCAGSWPAPRPLLSKEAYLDRVEAVLRYVAAGDVYQVNLAQPFLAGAVGADAASLFAALQARYPMPFAAYVDAGDFVAVSHSPECFLAVEDDRVSTFPIKGTRETFAGDSALVAADLRSDAKERAEHVMIVDLERNDLGRVCRPGSVEVAEFERVQAYPFLAHMISHVRGRLRPNVSLPELVQATFPGGSITGAPKIRAMEIIEELEPRARGLYTGAIGWTDLYGASRFNLAIRTAVLAGNRLTYWAGGGIVADSDPEREYEETWLKSRAFFRALASSAGEECRAAAEPSL